jgi:hypothetical protein
MSCPVCEGLKARIEGLYQLYTRISTKHLLAVQAENSESVRQYETLMFSYSEAIKKAETGSRRIGCCAGEINHCSLLRGPWTVSGVSPRHLGSAR